MQRTRRRLLLGAAALAAAPLARARAAGARQRLGLLFPSPMRTSEGSAVEFYTSILKDLGWIVGENLEVEYASGDGHEDRLPALAESLVQQPVDVIWVAGPEAAVAAARASRSIPIVFYGVGFPVEQGLVDSLAKPGRNVTGLASLAGGERAKGLEVLLEIAPGLRRLAWLWVETVARNVSGEEMRIRTSSFESEASALGFEVRRYPVSKPADLDGAFAAMLQASPQSLYCDFTAMTIRERHRIVEFANRNRLPAVYGAWRFIEAGGLLSYGPNRGWMFRHSFTFVDRILRGARPSELPVEFPTRFELVISLKTASVLGLSVPQSVLLRADRVIG